MRVRARGAGIQPRTRAAIDSSSSRLLLACLPLSAALVTIDDVQPASTVLVFVMLLGTTLVCGVLLARQIDLPPPWMTRTRVVSLGLLLAMGAVSLASAVALATVGDPSASVVGHVLVIGPLVLVAVCALMVPAIRGHRRLSQAALIGISLANLIVVGLREVRIDVLVFQRDGAAALIRGLNPYSLTFENPYSPEASRVFYGPGVFDGDRLLFGFPYPPASLLLALPGHLLGDVRLSMLGAVTVSSVLLWRFARDRFGRSCAVALAALPGTSAVLLNGWTEPLILALLTAVVIGAERGWRSTPFLLGVLLVTKQYVIVLLPVLWLLRATASRSPVGIRGFAARVIGTALIVSLPLALWAPAAFWDSVVRLQFRQPFRADSVSLLVWLVNHTGWPPPSAYGWLPLAAGFLTALLVAWRAPRTPAGFAAGVGVTLLVTFLLSKQAFANYYYLAVGALLVAAATWNEPTEPTSGPAAAAAPSTAAPAHPRPGHS